MSKRTKRLSMENDQLESQIHDADDRSVLTDMIVYIRSANISPYYQEKVRRDLCEMIVEGEKRGKPAKYIIGDDYKLFCDAVIAEIPKPSKKEYILSLFRDVSLSLDVLLIIWFLSNLFEKMIGDPLPLFTVTTGNVLCAVWIIIAAFGVVHVFSKNTFSIDTNRRNGILVILLLFVLTLISICLNTSMPYPLFHIHVSIAAAAIIVLFILYKILDMKID
ncbi:MAG: hypothetical protein Q4D31_03940 [Eubacteriales bacterium]|nr:hypothetical protein [Eubacteriales bacterium]